MKDICFLGDSLEQIKDYPETAKQKIGWELDRVQRGLDPGDWKSMSSVGAGAREIRVRIGTQYRVIYVAKCEDKVYVLHSFTKKTQRTPKRDLELARERYKEIPR